MLIPRILKKQVQTRLKGFPAVAILGPRQCGKTTLARGLGGAYYDLEQPAERLRLDYEWGAAVAGRGPLVLDEIQQFPELMPRLRGEIDARPGKKGRFLLLGSVSPELIKAMSESLAGRVAHCELTPFLLGEKKGLAEELLWLHGGFPRGASLGANAFPRWQTDYLHSLVSRDLPLWGLPAAPQVTRRFLEMVAASNAQPWNASEIGRSMGLSYHTVNSYLDYLEGAFIMRRLQPFHRNVKKRLTRSPRVYFRDSGLLHSLQGVTDQRSLFSRPWAGSSWEGFVIEQALSGLQARGIIFTASYFRTSDGLEADLVLERGGKLTAVEIKLSSAPAPEDMRRLRQAADLIGAERRILVGRVAKTTGRGPEHVASLSGLLELIQT